MSRYQHCPHKNCRFRAGDGAPNECDYAGITGRCRIVGLTREQARDKLHCPRYRPKEIRKRKKPNVMVPHVPRAAHYDWGKGRELYQAGRGDRRIARELGCSHQAVAAWRKKHGLPPNRGGT